MSKKAILLANLGSPDDCSVPAVRRYLNQFLMDPKVIQLPWILRRMIVSLFVLPSRPKQSAHAYQQIWTERGSPLVALSKDLQSSLQEKVESPVFLAMRYGNPSIESQLDAIHEMGDIDEVLFIALYPHYADSTVATSIDEVQRVAKEKNYAFTINPLPPFYDNPDYIHALIESSVPYLFERTANEKSLVQNINNGDVRRHVLFSYHGLPELHLTKADPTGSHCLKSKDCCKIKSEAHKTCYRHQVMETTRLFVEKAGLSSSDYTVCFQSRLGRAKWLEPSTENVIQKLAKDGVEELMVLCPAFVTDCLETLEEIGIRGQEIFEESGGKTLKLVPCLNTHPDWVNALAKWCE